MRLWLVLMLKRTSIPIDRALLAIKDKLEDDDNWCEKTTFPII